MVFSKKLLLLGVLFFTGFALNAQLQIVSQTNAQALAQQLVGNGIIISNVTLSADPLSTGFFNNMAGTSIGLDSGIVLSTGRVKTAGALYGFDGTQLSFASTTLNTPGDIQLDALVAPQVSFDAAILEFDFVPQGDTVKFRYVFSSEEYPTFTCSSFNDVFAFFISGPGITGTKNIALVPGTNIPVAINSVNDGTGGTLATCQAMGPGSPFVQYFVNNTGNSYFTHNGHTKVFTAQSPVVPCQVYHLKIAIADVFDHIYDSGVFLEAKSLSSPPLSIINANPISGGAAFIVEGCTNGSIKVARNKKLPTPQPVTLFFAGTATNGVDVQTIPTSVVIPANDSFVVVPIIPIADNINEGIETFKIYVSSGCVLAGNFSDSITIQIRDQMSATATTLPASCGGTGSINVVVPPNAGAGPYTYALDGGNFGASNVVSNVSPGTHTITVKDNSGCTFNLTTNVVLNNNLTISTIPNVTVCRGATFTPTVTSNGTSFSWSPAAGVSNPNILNPVITASGNQTYTLVATLGTCTQTRSFTVTTFAGITVDAGADQTIIVGDQAQLQATAPGGSYVWTPATGLSSTTILNPVASPAATTTYTLTATSPQGCTSSDNVTITVLPYCVNPMEAFSPNGDGINDLWLVTTGNCLESAKVEVFNRYGARVYEDVNYKNNWGGTYNGKPLADGTYYFVITYKLINGKPVFLKGNVTILR
jgi:gliding motility-associated-like protein